MDDVLYHCVWGWDGKNNGYYYYRDFDPDDSLERDEFNENGLIVKDEIDSNNDNWAFSSYYDCYFIGYFIPMKSEN